MMRWPWNMSAQQSPRASQQALIEALKGELAAKDRQIAAHDILLAEMRRLVAAQDDIIETLTERCAILKDNGEQHHA